MDKLRGVVAKVFLSVLFGLLIISFAIWGIGDIFRGTTGSVTIAKVGDTDVPQEEFRRLFSREFNRLRQQFGGNFDTEMARQIGLDRQVLQSLITRALINRQAQDLNMLVTDDQVRSEIFATPAFKNALGEFDRARYEQALRASGMSEGEFIVSLRGDIERQQIFSALTAGTEAPTVLTERLYAYRAEKRIADYIVVATDKLAPPDAPDNATLKAFYDESTASYMAPEYRTLSYVYLTPDSVYQEIKIDDGALRAAYEARKAEFTEPERRELRQILLDSEDAATAAYDRLREGADFAALAEELTDAPPIDLGSVTRDSMPSALSDAAFALALNTPSAPVASDFGWHILQVESIQPASESSFDEVRDTLRDELKHSQAVDSLVSIANQFDDQLGAGGTLEEAADKLGFTVRTLDALDRQGRDIEGNALADLPSPRRFVETAFELDAGAESLLQETEDGGYFVLRVDGVTPEKVRRFEDVREQVLANWQAQERQTRAFAQADSLAERLRGGETLEALSFGENLSVTRTGQLDRFAREPSPNLASALFELKPGEVTVADGPEGPIIAVLREIAPADPKADEAQVAALGDEVARTLSQDIAQRFLNALQTHYGVSVNNDRVDETLALF
jgi:peptidyl-prolyl cis-trans isomerase D